jgi:hypothetical protein
MNELVLVATSHGCFRRIHIFDILLLRVDEYFVAVNYLKIH